MDFGPLSVHLFENSILAGGVTLLRSCVWEREADPENQPGNQRGYL
jgi:hypothetical protein